MATHRIEVVVTCPEGELGRLSLDLPEAPAGSPPLPEAVLETMVRQVLARAAGSFPLHRPDLLRRARAERPVAPKAPPA